MFLYFGQYTKDGKKGPEREKHAAPEDNSDRQFLFIFFQPRSNERPALIEDNGKTQQYTNEQRELYIGYKSFRQIGVDHTVHHRACLEERIDDELGNLFGKKIGTSSAQSDGNEAANQSLSEFIMMRPEKCKAALESRHG